MNTKILRTNRAERLLRYVTCAIFAHGVIALAQAPSAFEVNDHRPLAVAAGRLQSVLGIAINYEDVPYQNREDLEDVSTAQQRGAYPGYALLVPRKGTVASTIISGPGSSDGEKILDVSGILNSYRTNRLPGEFSLEQANGMLYVVPARVKNTAGAMRDVVSPMRAEITVPYAERTIIDTIVAVVESIGRSSGTKISVGRVPFYPKLTTSFGVTRQQARDAFAALFSRLAPGGASYQLLFDPVAGYMLNVDVFPVQPTEQSPSNSRKVDQGSDRFFVKN